MVVALFGERPEERQESVCVESESEDGFQHAGGFGVGWHRRGYFLRFSSKRLIAAALVFSAMSMYGRIAL